MVAAKGQADKAFFIACLHSPTTIMLSLCALPTYLLGYSVTTHVSNIASINALTRWRLVDALRVLYLVNVHDASVINSISCDYANTTAYDNLVTLPET